MMQYNKGVLEGNVFTKGNQRLTITGLPTLTLISRDAITVEQGMIELADKTRIPGGRNASGEFNVVAQLANDSDREAFLNWYNMCLNYGRGINPNYKRDALLTFMRHFEGSPDTEFRGAGKRGEPFTLKLIGTWPQSIEFPEYSLSDGDEGDADAHITIKLCFDDVDPQEKRGGVGFLN